MPFGPTKDLGPVICAWGSTVIQEIWDEVRWTLTGESADVFEMLYGATPVDSVFLGYSTCSITIPATRIALATLATILPGGVNHGGATGAVRGLAKAAVGNSMGSPGITLAKNLTSG